METAFIEMLRGRRSVRQFEQRAIEPEKIALLKEAVLRSPGSRNLDPWEFVFVDDRALLKKLSRLKPHGSEFLEGAALAIVICGDENTSDVWVEDCAIASILVQLAAQSLGLASCWVQVRRRFYDPAVASEEYVRQTLHLPDRLSVLSVVGIGYGAEKLEGWPDQSLKRERIHLNGW